MPVGDRERNRGLAIILFAKPPTISPRHAYGMLALLRKARVIDDDQGHEMEKRLVLRRNSRWRRNRRQGLNALALAAGKQARIVIAERPRPVAMTNGFA